LIAGVKVIENRDGVRSPSKANDRGDGVMVQMIALALLLFALWITPSHAVSDIRVSIS
jgi:hypothetical protein